MQIRWVIACLTKDAGGFVETIDLIARERLAAGVVSGGEVTHQAVDAYIAEAIEF